MHTHTSMLLVRILVVLHNIYTHAYNTPMLLVRILVVLHNIYTHAYTYSYATSEDFGGIT